MLGHFEALRGEEMMRFTRDEVKLVNAVEKAEQTTTPGQVTVLIIALVWAAAGLSFGWWLVEILKWVRE